MVFFPLVGLTQDTPRRQPLRILMALSLWIPGANLPAGNPWGWSPDSLAGGCRATKKPTAEKHPNDLHFDSSSSRSHRKSGKKAANRMGGGFEGSPGFRKLDAGKMKSRKSCAQGRFASRVAHGLHRRAETRCGKRRLRVQSLPQTRKHAGLREARFAHWRKFCAIRGRRSRPTMGPAGLLRR
jgi:hypothetical protein